MTIRMIAMDVDGTMTDGSIYISSTGEIFKKFNVKDGFGIKKAQQNNLQIAIITGRTSSIVEKRAEELSIDTVLQGVSDKYAALCTLLQEKGLKMSEVAYIGDDVNDLEVIEAVGMSFCPADATEEVRNKCTKVLVSSGGQGAVRECIEYILTVNSCESRGI